MVVQGTNVAHLLELQALAMSLSLPTYLVQDAGLTQVKAFLSYIQISVVVQVDIPNILLHYQ